MKKLNMVLCALVILTLVLTGCRNGEVTEPPVEPTKPEETEPPEEPPRDDLLCRSELGVEFESFTVGDTFAVFDRVELENGVILSFEPFIWGDGTPTAGGYAEIQDDKLAGGSGKDLLLNNINVRFDFPCMIKGLSLYYGAYGGNLNIEINGDFVNFNDFADIDGTTIDDVFVTVNDLGGGLGILTLEGEIFSFSIGGQELWIDVVCPESFECDVVCLEFCVSFEDQKVGTQYKVFEWFKEGDVVVAFAPFFWSDGTPTVDGYAEIFDIGDAGGSGNELMINNINVRFIFPCIIEGLILKFGEYGGNLNIKINGEFVNFEDFTEIDGMMIGGVKVSVPSGGFGNDQGELVLEGKIYSFMIGGQELLIDDICSP